MIFSSSEWKVIIGLCIFITCYSVSKYLKALIDQSLLCGCGIGKDSISEVKPSFSKRVVYRRVASRDTAPDAFLL